MKELLEALGALERLGASWKARRVSKRFIYDTVQCTALVQTDQGVIRGLVVIQRSNTFGRAKMEVTCFLDGHLKEDGVFEEKKHPKDKKIKLFEYDNEIMYRYSRVFGIGLGWKPESRVSAEYQYLVDFAEWLIAETDREDQATKSAKEAEKRARKIANEAKARKALFG